MNATTKPADPQFEDLCSNMQQLPSERDWAAYRAVRIEQRTTRAVAHELGISQTRLLQMVEQAAAFIGQTTPVPTKEDEARQLAAGKQLAADRIEFLYGKAVRSFRLSQQRDPTDCASQRSGSRHGDARYLHCAARLAIMASTLPPPRLLPMERNVPQETCSALPGEQPALAAFDEASGSATVDAMKSCVEQSRPDAEPAQTESRPVQERVAGRKPTASSNRQATQRQSFFQTG